VVSSILEGIEDVNFTHLTSTDVVRHRLVSDIVDAYGRWDAERAAREGDGARAAGDRGRPVSREAPRRARGRDAQ
ncbi:MAG: PhoH family protein, partial [Actinomycetes bacterium]